jgi:hypothetical protein
MVDQDLKIVKVPFAIVAPRASKDFFNIGMTALFLCHVGWSDTEKALGRVDERSTLCE